MHEFYQRSLVRFIALLTGSLIAGYLLVERSFLHLPLLPAAKSALPWRIVSNTDADRGGRSTIRVERDLERLRFAFTISRAVEHPVAAAELHFVDGKGRPAHVDLSRYGSVGFFVRCAPANTLAFSAPTFDAGISRRGNLLTYRTPAAFFSCNENRSYIELDLSRLETPQWWFQMFKVDISRQAYRLDQVPRVGFSSTFQSPQQIPATVEISDLELRGRDYRYLVFLCGLLALAWGGFAVWFFRAHNRALIEDVKSKLQKDLPLVAYQQLTLEPHRDKEKAAVLGYIGTYYADPELNLDKVVDRTGVNRNKISDMLKAELGFTFSGYVNKLRLTEAARLLADKDNAAVAQIAYSVGYGHVSYFNKLFKEEYGCTPKAFRDACASASSESD